MAKKRAVRVIFENLQLAIDRATPQTLHIKMDMSCYKFIGAIRKLKSLSHIDWEFKHVEGHQDDVRHVSDLN